MKRSRLTSLNSLKLLLTVGVVLSCARGLASKIEKISLDQMSFVILHDSEDPWQVGDSLCVMHGAKEAACGHVLKTTPKGAIVVVDQRHEKLAEGDDVEEKKEREPTGEITDEKADGAAWDSEQETEVAVPAKKETESEYKARVSNMDRLELVDFHRDIIHRRGELNSEDGAVSVRDKLKRNYNLSFGGQLFGNSNGNSLWPELYFQYALSRNYSLGLAVNYFAYNVAGINVTSIGATAFFEFFPMDTMNGVFSRLGVGLASSDYTSPSPDGSTTYTGNSLSYHIDVSVGWRWIIGSSFNISLSAGAIYSTVAVGPAATGGGSSTTSAHAVALLPVGLVEFGFTF